MQVSPFSYRHRINLLPDDIAMRQKSEAVRPLFFQLKKGARKVKGNQAKILLFVNQMKHYFQNLLIIIDS